MTGAHEPQGLLCAEEVASVWAAVVFLKTGWMNAIMSPSLLSLNQMFE